MKKRDGALQGHKLTNSIVNTISQDCFPTDIHLITKSDLKNISKKNGWLFNWTSESKMVIFPREALKLIGKYFPNLIKLKTMGHIKEPIGVDFVVDPKPLTNLLLRSQ